MITILKIVKNNPKLKRFMHWLLIPNREARPRTWVKWFVNPFFHRRGKGSVIRRKTRIDVLPFNKFELGDYSVIEDFSTINNGVGAVIIGNETLIGMGNVVIGPVTIGNNVIVAQNVVMSGLNHQYTDPNIPISKQSISTGEIIIEEDCWIAANVVITAGVTIGKHSVIAAGAVVTKNVPPYTISAGNPAKPIKSYNAISKKWECV